MEKSDTIKIDEQEYVRKDSVPTGVKLDLSKEIPEGKAPYSVGQAYLFRTVTMALLGRVESVGKQEIVISEAGWLADTGRFHDCLRTQKINEFEPAGNPDDHIIVNRQAMIDAWPWHGELPKEQK